MGDALAFETQDEVRDWIDDLSDHIGEWQGIPVPLGDETPLVLTPNHPLRDFFASRAHTCSVDDVCEEERVVNKWFSRKRNGVVWVIERAGRYSALFEPKAPDRSMERLMYWMSTIGGADAWSLDAEHTARELLRGMLTERQWRHYDLTGAFFETSPRSRVTYLFRRLRPTVAMSPRGTDCREGDDAAMRCLAVLCLHPIGYYADSWAGCMTPSDDVIAHLMLMRADEAKYWGKAILHRPQEPEAGL